MPDQGRAGGTREPSGASGIPCYGGEEGARSHGGVRGLEAGGEVRGNSHRQGSSHRIYDGLSHCGILSLPSATMQGAELLFVLTPSMALFIVAGMTSWPLTLRRSSALSLSLVMSVAAGMDDDTLSVEIKPLSG